MLSLRCIYSAITGSAPANGNHKEKKDERQQANRSVAVLGVGQLRRDGIDKNQ